MLKAKKRGVLAKGVSGEPSVTPRRRKKYQGYWGPALHLAVRAPQPREARVLAETPLLKTPFSLFLILWSQIQNYIAEADADRIPVAGQLELHGRCRYRVLLSPCFGACYSSQIKIVGMEELELHYRCRGRSNFRTSGIATISVRMVRLVILK